MNVIFLNVVFIMSNAGSFFIYVYCDKRNSCRWSFECTHAYGEKLVALRMNPTNITFCTRLVGHNDKKGTNSRAFLLGDTKHFKLHGTSCKH
jgi:hypothetical protein